MRQRRLLAVLALLAIFFTSGCSGATSASGNAAVPISNATRGTGTARFALNVPKAALGARGYRRRDALSLETASITIALTSVNGSAQSAAPTVIDLLPNSASCVPDPSGEAIVVCSVSVDEPAGNDVFSIAAFDEPNATGDRLSAGTVTAAITAGTSANVPLTFDPIIASLTILVTSPAVAAGAKTTEQIFVQAQDAGGATIIGSDPFVSPVVLTVNDPEQLLSLDSTTVTDPAMIPNAIVDASAVSSGSATIGATVGNVAATSITPATIVIDNDRHWTNGATFAYTGATTSTSSFPGVEPTTSTSTNSSSERFSTNGGSIVRSVTTTSSAGTSTQTYTYSLVGDFSTTHLDLDTYDETDVYGGQLANQYGGEDIVDELPEAAGQTFTNANAFTSTYQASANDPSPSDTYAFNEDGSYDFALSYANGDVTTVSADPVAGASYTYAFAAGGSVSYVIATPAPGPSGAAAIAVVRTIVSASPSASASASPSASPIASAAPTPFDAPDWYPATPPVSQVLQTDTEADLGSQTVPRACGVAAAFGITANQIHEDYFDLDPVLGEAKTESIDTYVSPATGVLCRSNLTTVDVYYYENDFSSESTPLSMLFTGTLLATYVTQTYSGLQSIGTTSQATLRRRPTRSKPTAAGGFGHRERTMIRIDDARDAGLGGR